MKHLKQILKFLAAGITAVLILDLLLIPYYVLPVHRDNPLGNTDYIWPPNAVWIKLTEGVSWGKMDEAGYNNPQVIENPDILLLGSSHAEGMNVFQNQNAGALLREAFRGTYTVYNKSISSHPFDKVAQYLRRNLELYEKAPRYVVIETRSLSLTEESVEQILTHRVPVSHSHASGLMLFLQNNPFIRLLYQQVDTGLMDLLLPAGPKAETVAAAEPAPTVKVDPAPYERLMAYFGGLQQEFGTQILIYYHPTGVLQKDGSVLFPMPEETEVFARACRENGVVFLDLSQAFYELYEQEHKLPHGFPTGLISDGHLNADGHRVIARQIYETILELEGR